MHILYFSKDYSPHDYRFLSSLSQTGNKISYLRLERRGRSVEDRALPPQVEIIPWAGGTATVGLKDAPRLLASLKRVIAELKPDLIHAGPIQTVSLLVALSGFHPLVSMSWGFDLLRDADINWRYRWATRFTLARSDVLVGDCDAVRQKAVRHGFPAGQVVTFPWGLDLRKFSPGGEDGGLRARAGWEHGFVLLHTRSWEPVYGVDVIARAFSLAARQHPELCLFLLGGGSLAGQIRDILRKNGVLDRVHFSGQINQKDLPRYYQAADLYLSASHSDGSSLSLMEALACGKPVLVSDIPGNREWVVHGKHGWFFPDGDVQALADGILHAYEQRAMLPDMGRAGRDLAEERANWDENFQELLRAYEMALGKVRT
jgi:glycosyltransferase involved in cell wall biosynthesis